MVTADKRKTYRMAIVWVHGAHRCTPGDRAKDSCPGWRPPAPPSGHTAGWWR
uniref:Uncharacterized protein n=1 Tax=Steinernema glaseri TaxID=37863 RepID=A0A1I8A6H1_9BILA